MRLLYNLAIRLYVAAIGLASLFNPKAKRWRVGRKDWKAHLKNWRQQVKGPVVWVHCASLGEFEQGRPVIEAVRSDYPHVHILLTFFSPSGYEVRKHYNQVSGVFYLPADTPLNAHQFLNIVSPSMAIMVKYEYWLNYLRVLGERQIPTYALSAIFRPGQRFFSGPAMWRHALKTFSHFFVQDEASARLLAGIGMANCTVTGDTRYDRVQQLASTAFSDAAVEKFVQGSLVIAGGSTYPPEERIIHHLLQGGAERKAIVVPHEVDEARIEHVLHMFGNAALRLSCLTEGIATQYRVVVVDSIGKLGLLYRYAHVALVGGGYGKGIHNVLEAAVYGVPVAFGPNYQRFNEARLLIAEGAAVSRSAPAELQNELEQLCASASSLKQMGDRAALVIKRQMGAAHRVMNHLAESLKAMQDEKNEAKR